MPAGADASALLDDDSASVEPAAPLPVSTRLKL
jgi:hypothetical protein